MDVGSLLMPRAILTSGKATREVFMPRLKLALGLVLLAGALVAAAIAILNPFSASSTMNRPERAAIEGRRNGEGVGIREKKNPAKRTDSDSVIRDFVNAPGQMNQTETNAPRMHQKQIKMH